MGFFFPKQMNARAYFVFELAQMHVVFLFRLFAAGQLKCLSAFFCRPSQLVVRNRASHWLLACCVMRYIGATGWYVLRATCYVLPGTLNTGAAGTGHQDTRELRDASVS
jgi:hypothetical protein